MLHLLLIMLPTIHQNASIKMHQNKQRNKYNLKMESEKAI